MAPGSGKRRRAHSPKQGAAPATHRRSDERFPRLAKPLDRARATRSGRSPGSRVNAPGSPSRDSRPVAAPVYQAHDPHAHRLQLQGQPRICTAFPLPARRRVSSRVNPHLQLFYLENQPGGAEGDRTPDLVIANDALSQLSYGPVQVTCRAKASRSEERAT